MSIPEAIKGAQAELARIHSPLQRVQRLAVYARIFAAELFGTVLAVPFGLRAFSLHRSLPDARTAAGRAGTVSILRDIRYGPRSRNTLDIYLPPSLEPRGGSHLLEPGPTTGPVPTLAGAGSDGATGSAGAAASDQAGVAPGAGGGAPVVLFCHGGVWASGSKWHYAPLATRLAQAGVVTAVMSYSLYPQALIPQMVAEVSRALSWTMDNAGQLGGDPQQVSLVGHSAGAHLCTMALLHRALAASKAAGPRVGTGGGSPSNAATAAPPEAQAAAAQSGSPPGGQQEQQEEQQLRGAPAGGQASEAMGEAEEAAAFGDHRMPHRLVAIAGVYDIAKHYEYEEARHVHKLSTMERACGGDHLFPAFSPAVILADALGRHRQAAAARHRSWEQIAGDPSELLEEAGVAGSGARGGLGWAGAPTGAPGGGAAAGASGPACAFVRSGEEAARAAAGAAAGAGQQGRQQGPAGLGEAAASPPPAVAAARYYQSFDLAGEAIARRIGFDRVAAAEAAGAGAAPAAAAARSSAAAARAVPAVAPAAAAPGAAADGGGPWRIFGLTVDAVRRLPPTVLTSSCTDVTVPWFESAEMYWMLHDCGVPAKHLVYNKVGHGQFVTDWAALPRISGGAAADESDLPPHSADLVKILVGHARVAYSRADE